MPHTTCWTYASYHMHMHECCPSAIYPFILAHSHLGSLEAARRPLFQSPETPVTVGLVQTLPRGVQHTPYESLSIDSITYLSRARAPCLLPTAEPPRVQQGI